MALFPNNGLRCFWAKLWKIGYAHIQWLLMETATQLPHCRNTSLILYDHGFSSWLKVHSLPLFLPSFCGFCEINASQFVISHLLYLQGLCVTVLILANLTDVSLQEKGFSKLLPPPLWKSVLPVPFLFKSQS